MAGLLALVMMIASTSKALTLYSINTGPNVTTATSSVFSIVDNDFSDYYGFIDCGIYNDCYGLYNCGTVITNCFSLI